jgi:hypothetical protein
MPRKYFFCSFQNRAFKSADIIYPSCLKDASRVPGTGQTLAKIFPLMSKDSSHNASHINAITDAFLGNMFFPRTRLNCNKLVLLLC